MNLNMNGKRDEWEFEYTASKLAEGARKQKEHRLSRVTAWKEVQQNIMAEVRESGIEVIESAGAGMSSYANTASVGPKVSVRSDLQQKLTECHLKVQSHSTAAAEYDGWIQVLESNPESRLKLTQGDWLYFFGKI